MGGRANPGSRSRPTVRRLLRAAGWLLPLGAMVVVVVVLRSAGIPVTVPGILVALVVLFVARAGIGWSRRRRRDHPISSRDRPR